MWSARQRILEYIYSKYRVNLFLHVQLREPSDDHVASRGLHRRHSTLLVQKTGPKKIVKNGFGHDVCHYLSGS